MFADRVFQRLIETRPAGAAFEFGLRRKQRQVATGAGKNALAMLFQERTRSGPFGALVAQYFVLLRGKLRAPFGVGLFNLEFLGSLRRFGTQPAERGEAAGSSSTVSSAVARSAGTDCDVPPSAARPPMIGRSAA